LLGQIIDYGFRFYNKPHPLFTLKNLRFFREPEFNMVTSPPDPLSLKGEGERNKKEGLKPLLNALFYFLNPLA
jgi:hypothetical protein